MPRAAHLGFLLLLALLPAGCRTPRAIAPNPFEIDRAEYARIFDASQEVLRQEGFTLDRRDYRFGRIDTQPLGSPTLFEPWRPTNSTAYQTYASTINYQRRFVIITLEPIPAAPPATAPAATAPAEPTAYNLRLEVQLQQLEIPARQLTGSAQGQRVQSRLRDVPVELRDRAIVGSYWRSLGRDLYLEQRLLAAIIHRSMQLK